MSSGLSMPAIMPVATRAWRTLLQGGAEEAEVRLCRAPRCRGRNRALELESGARVAAKDHHTALRSEVLGKINAGYVEIVLAKLQSGKDDVAFTLHVNPSAFTSGGLQTTDWLRFLGFKENAQCQFANARQCFSKEVPEVRSPAICHGV
jgi:hypothetical protein